MKITTEPVKPQFSPVSITFETETELNEFVKDIIESIISLQTRMGSLIFDNHPAKEPIKRLGIIMKKLSEYL